MPRHPYKKSTTNQDPVYGSLELAKFINYVMVDGKKTTAQEIIYDVMESLKKENEDPLKFLHKAISNVAPTVEVKPRRLGGASYLVPTEVRKDRRLYLALNWIIEAAKTKSNKEYHSFSAKILHELHEAAQNQGQAVGKRLQAEKLAEANKAFSHLKW